VERGEILLGIDDWKFSKEKTRVPIFWREDRVINHHVGVAGTTGAGKTHWIREFIHGMPEHVEIDVFDYHGDIEISGAKSVIFSEATRYGYNPLVLNPDPHYGGVRRGISDVLNAMTQTGRVLGGNQEGVLRNLLIDTYAARGIVQDDPRSWNRREATQDEILSLQSRQDWDTLRATYPTLDDVIRMAKRKLRALYLMVEDSGKGATVLSAFDAYCRSMRAFKSSTTALRNKISPTDDDQNRLAVAKEKALEAHAAYLDTIESGRELDETIKYGNKDVLQSTITRLENLVALGLFNANPPPFAEARIRRYVIKPLASSTAELVMFVHFRLQTIIREMMQLGESGGRLRRLVVLDESKVFNSEDPHNPINKIVNEMRKFGLAILLAGQSPAHFSEDFVKGAGTLLLLNLATADWDDAARKLKIEKEKLRFLRPQQSGAIRMLEKGQGVNFRQIRFE
jgi:hypothetical protein